MRRVHFFYIVFSSKDNHKAVRVRQNLGVSPLKTRCMLFRQDAFYAYRACEFFRLKLPDFSSLQFLAFRLQSSNVICVLWL